MRPTRVHPRARPLARPLAPPLLRPWAHPFARLWRRTGHAAGPGGDLRTLRAGISRKRTRSASGAPSAAYWQNRADYRITARIDTNTKRLSGEEVISYTNNSPDALDALWVQLDQNIYRPDARATFLSRYYGRGHTDGDVIEQVSVTRDGHTEAAAFLVSDTRMRVALAQPLAPKGGRLRLRIRWHYTVPGPGAAAPRSARRATATSTRSRNGSRAWRSMTTCAAGIPSPTWDRNSISNTATSITA